jgi:hypothetical protein
MEEPMGKGETVLRPVSVAASDKPLFATQPTVERRVTVKKTQLMIL